MRLRSPLVGLVVAALVVLAGVAPAGVAHAAEGVHASPPPPTDTDREVLGDVLAQSGVETDNVRLVVTLSENGSARWEVQYWTRLDDDNTTRAFESLQRDVAANPDNYSRQFADRMRTTVASAENATGREMSADNFSVTAEKRGPPQYGVVTYSFQWEGFAVAEGDTVRAGDAIEGIFLDTDTRLILQWPDEYSAVNVTPDADERRDDAAVWRGADTEFVSGEPTVVLTRGTPTETGAAGGGDVRSPSAGGLGSPLSLALGALVFGVVGVLAWRFWKRRETGGAPLGRSDGDDDGDAPPEDAPDSGDESESDPRPELLSNEERVLKFVRDRGGRVKQQEVVREFDWTEARTSQIVRQLRDDGKLEGFRLGRENVLKLPGEDGSGSGSDAAGEGRDA